MAKGIGNVENKITKTYLPLFVNNKTISVLSVYTLHNIIIF